MMITDTIALVRKRRNDLNNRKSSKLNERIKNIRVELVKLSFQNAGSAAKKAKLLQELESLKSKLTEPSDY